jgi:hypothetical protein
MKRFFRIRSNERDKNVDRVRIEKIRGVIEAVCKEYAKESEGLRARLDGAQQTIAFLIGSDRPNFGTDSPHSERLSTAERNIVLGQARLGQIEKTVGRLRGLEARLSGDTSDEKS